MFSFQRLSEATFETTPLNRRDFTTNLNIVNSTGIFISLTKHIKLTSSNLEIFIHFAHLSFDFAKYSPYVTDLLFAKNIYHWTGLKTEILMVVEKDFFLNNSNYSMSTFIL